jgi:hypothetical protein
MPRTLFQKIMTKPITVARIEATGIIWSGPTYNVKS